MQKSQTALIRVSVAASLFAACVAAHAASGIDGLCDRSDQNNASLDVAVERLRIVVIDHGDANTVAADDLAAAEDAPPTELTVLGIDEKSPGLIEADEADIAGDETGPPTANTRFPGVSDEDWLRYRHQMYRTDI